MSLADFNQNCVLERILDERQDFLKKKIDIGFKKAVLWEDINDFKQLIIKYYGFNEHPEGKIESIENIGNYIQDNYSDYKADFDNIYGNIKKSKKYSTKLNYLNDMKELIKNSSINESYNSILSEINGINGKDYNESLELIDGFAKEKLDNASYKKFNKLKLNQNPMTPNDVFLLSLKKNIISLSKIGKEYEGIISDIDSLSEKFMGIDLINNYFKSGKSNASLLEILESSEISMGNDLAYDVEGDSSLLKNYAGILLTVEYERNNVNKIINMQQKEISGFFESINVSKESFEKVYVHGNKSRVLEDIIKSVLSNNMHEDFLPKEIMELIESEYNFITFSGANSSGKVYINKGTFSSAWYKVKKELKNKPYFVESDAIQQTLTDLITQSDMGDLKFELLSKEDLLNFLPDYSGLKKLKEDGENEIFSDLSPILEEEWKYSSIDSDILKGRLYSQLFKKLENPYKNHFIENLEKETLVNFCNKYNDKMVLNYRINKNINLIENINNFSILSHNLLGMATLNENNERMIDEKSFNHFITEIKKFISESANSNNQLSISKIKIKYEAKIEKEKEASKK